MDLGRIISMKISTCPVGRKIFSSVKIVEIILEIKENMRFATKQEV